MFENLTKDELMGMDRLDRIFQMQKENQVLFTQLENLS